VIVEVREEIRGGQKEGEGVVSSLLPTASFTCIQYVTERS
jgi:hypothetical protein